MIEAADSAALQAAVRRVVPEVPLRGMGRTNRQTEPWIMCNVLAALDLAAGISYPLKLVHCDRPDFRLVHGATRVGIELTEVVDPETAAAKARANKAGDDDELPHADPEKRAVLESRRKFGWTGDSAEAEASQRIRAAVEKKVATAQKAGFELLPENWVIVYENSSPPGTVLEVATAKLADVQFAPFDRLIILAGQRIALLTSGGGVEFIDAALIG